MGDCVSGLHILIATSVLSNIYVSLFHVAIQTSVSKPNPITQFCVNTHQRLCLNPASISSVKVSRVLSMMLYIGYIINAVIKLLIYLNWDMRIIWRIKDTILMWLPVCISIEIQFGIQYKYPAITVSMNYFLILIWRPSLAL
jgi:hypothetical protein